VLHGFGGQGKTSLATQAAEWFTRTRLFDRAAFISFETGASLDFVLNELGNALVEDNFQIHEGDKVEAIAQSLKEKPALVVFDNFESVLPNGNAPMQELKDLLNAAAKWFGADGGQRMEDRTASVGPRSSVLGQSRLLVTTRNTDIPHPSFTPSKTCLHKELEGLAASDALELAASILEAHSLPRPARVPLEELLKFLKGHPLSLQLALPQLSDYSAGQLVEQYQSILPQMKKGEAKERNESLEVSLRFSLDRLGADALNWLSRVWIFEGGAMESVLLAISEIPEETWNVLKPQLTSTALIRVEEIPGVSVPFIHFHPTLVPYLRAISDNSKLDNLTTDSQSSNIEERYWQGYYNLANSVYRADTKNPIQARAIVLRELPNLKRALKRALAAGALDEAVNFAARLDRFLDAFGRWRERGEIAAEVEKYTSKQGNKNGKITKREYLLESGRGERLWQQGRAGDAEQIFRALLKRLEGDAEYDTRYDQISTFRDIGHCLRNQGQSSKAVEEFR
jgi:tetratricopeptide (TPR) repeat protein